MDDDTFENISVYECLNRKGLKEDIISAASEAVRDIEPPPLQGRKRKHPDFSSIVRDWVDTFNLEEFEVGKYLIENNSRVYFGNQDLVDSFRSYYMENG